MDNLCQPQQARFFQIVLEHNRFERAAPLVMAQFHPRRIEGDRSGLFYDSLDFTPGNKNKLRIAVYKAGDQPRASHAVNMDVRTSNPYHRNLQILETCEIDPGSQV